MSSPNRCRPHPAGLLALRLFLSAAHHSLSWRAYYAPSEPEDDAPEAGHE